MQTLKERIWELTDGLTSVNEALSGLVAQAGQFARLTGAMGAPPPPPPLDVVPAEIHLAPKPSFQFSAEEMAKRSALLKQFNGKEKMREQLEEEMDSGAAQ